MKHQIQGRFNICSSPGECLVTVHAQVMAWDDKFSGWIPFDGGGVSAVSLYQRLVLPSPPLPVEMEPIQAAPHPQGFEPGITAFETAHSMVARYEYFIFGQRIDDKKVLLNCTITKNIIYRQVMPTFHHWQIIDEKYGLKFMTSYEACKFHNKLQKAIEHLARQSKSSSGESNVDAGDLEDEVFVPVDLPLSRESSESSGSKIPTAVGPSSRSGFGLPLTVSRFPQPSDVQVVVRPSSTFGYPYVEFHKEPIRASMHQYGSTSGFEVGKAITRQPLIESMERPLSSAPNLPLFDVSTPSTMMPPKRPSVTSVKMPGLQPLIPQKPKKPGSSGGSVSEIVRRDQCFYCKQYYSVRDNVRGSCAEAPDACDKWIRRLTCMWCADCLLYCCCREDDGDLLGTRRCRHLTTVALLALVLPCLWCYPPLAACRNCCRRCGWIAGRHKPIGSSSPEYSRSEHSSSYK